MRAFAAFLAAALLYGAGAITANPAFAGGLGAAALEDLRGMTAGAMAMLVFHDAPREPVATRFLDATGAETGFDAFRGKVLVANFWATWCPPCREEMPSLDRLRAQVAGDDIEVIAVAIQRGGLKKAARFYEEHGIVSLGLHADEAGALPPALRLLGYPVTVILDREGREIARMQGDAEWDSPEAVAILERIAAETGAGEVIRTDAGAQAADG